MVFLLTAVDVLKGLNVDPVLILCDFFTCGLDECEGRLRDLYPTDFVSSGEAYSLALAVGLNDDITPKQEQNSSDLTPPKPQMLPSSPFSLLKVSYSLLDLDTSTLTNCTMGGGGGG